MAKVWFITKKVLRWLGIITLVLITILILGIEIFDRYLSSERGTKWLYSESPQKESLEIRFTKAGVRYLLLGDPSKPAMMLIHGAPGSVMDWSSMAKRSRIFDHFRLIIPDRPGYGGTKPRGAVTSVKTQAELLLDVLKEEKTTATVLGHSYGGPIAVAMGALDSNRVERVIGVSGQYMPDNEVVFYASYFIRFRLFNYILPRMIWVANEEKMEHPDALMAVQDLFKHIAVPVFLIHGDKDTLVYYENSTFLEAVIGENAELVTMEGHDHPVHMTATDELLDIILSVLIK